MSSTLYDQHLDNCDTCRNNPLGGCPEANQILQQTTESGHGGEYERALYEARTDRH